MTEIPLKPKNYQNTPTPKKMTKIPQNLKISKIPLKPKYDQHVMETEKLL